MGLNLNISRVIFSTVNKTVKGVKLQLDKHSIKQIGGRAGRYMTDGYVTAFASKDLAYISSHIGHNEQKK